ncbi:MAG: uracil-DNA glycosylase [Thermoplasmata archaeon]
MATPALEDLRARVVSCTRCPRLVDFRQAVSEKKRRAFEKWTYWGRPVPGFGDPDADLVIVGLAPAAHGGNRTGRIFTGDPSAAFLMRGLYEAGFASQPTSESREDGLHLRNAYMTAAVRCVPPDNRPVAEEIHNCAPYLKEEMKVLRPRAILALGHLAFNASADFLEQQFGVRRRKLKFHHGGTYEFKSGMPTLFASYHPSPRNTNTGLLSPESFHGVLHRIRGYLDSIAGNPHASRNAGASTKSHP